MNLAVGRTFLAEVPLHQPPTPGGRCAPIMHNNAHAITHAIASTVAFQSTIVTTRRWLRSLSHECDAAQDHEKHHQLRPQCQHCCGAGLHRGGGCLGERAGREECTFKFSPGAESEDDRGGWLMRGLGDGQERIKTRTLATAIAFFRCSVRSKFLNWSF